MGGLVLRSITFICPYGLFLESGHKILRRVYEIRSTSVL